MSVIHDHILYNGLLTTLVSETPPELYDGLYQYAAANSNTYDEFLNSLESGEAHDVFANNPLIILKESIPAFFTAASAVLELDPELLGMYPYCSICSHEIQNTVVSPYWLKQVFHPNCYLQSQTQIEYIITENQSVFTHQNL